MSQFEIHFHPFPKIIKGTKEFYERYHRANDMYLQYNKEDVEHSLRRIEKFFKEHRPQHPISRFDLNRILKN